MRHRVDFLVLGSGAAGLTYALRVAEHGSVAVVTKKASLESNTNYAQGGIAAVMDAADSFEDHVRDTLDAGAGLCDEGVVRTIVNEGPEQITDLIRGGAAFSRDGDHLHLGREGGHSANRIVHAADATGNIVERSLVERVQNHPQIELYEYHYAVELLTSHHLGVKSEQEQSDIECFGAYVYNVEKDQVEIWLSKVTMLATGGAGQVYLHTTNPSVATGDGVAMAYRAKAQIANMEFVQFHPTSLYHEDARSYLISEAVRGEGAHLLNADGHRFMADYDSRGELAPRDIVARAIDDQLKIRGDNHVWLDISHRPSDLIQEHFPNIYSKCLELGLDITKERIPVVPAAHYFCGGVQTDVDGRTSIGQLLACGEVACTGLHGANRLASNSLLEALVVGKRAADVAIEIGQLQHWVEEVPDWDDSSTENPAEWVMISHNRDELQRVMWDYVGIVRSELRLNRAARRTQMLFEETEDFFRRTKVSAGLCELRNMIAVAHLIVRSASKRHESRGLHYMIDFPNRLEGEEIFTLI